MALRIFDENRRFLNGHDSARVTWSGMATGDGVDSVSAGAELVKVVE